MIIIHLSKFIAKHSGFFVKMLTTWTLFQHQAKKRAQWFPMETIVGQNTVEASFCSHKPVWPKIATSCHPAWLLSVVEGTPSSANARSQRHGSLSCPSSSQCCWLGDIAGGATLYYLCFGCRKPLLYGTWARQNSPCPDAGSDALLFISQVS